MSKIRAAFFVLAAMLATSQAAQSQQNRFHLEEATIDGVHRAIQQGQITCRGLVQLYIKRAKAYNGVADELVTTDGAPVPSAPGVVRAGSPVKYPTQTIAISTLLPNFDQYAGPPIEFGRMEPTASDPSVQQQYGMTIGGGRADLSGRGPGNQERTRRLSGRHSGRIGRSAVAR
jgi:amidase